MLTFEQALEGFLKAAQAKVDAGPVLKRLVYVQCPCGWTSDRWGSGLGSSVWSQYRTHAEACPPKNI
jgi:hypothetical protein